MEEILKKLNYQPSGLTDDEIKDPADAIIELFENYPLHVMRTAIWQFYIGWVNYSYDYTNEREIKDMIYLYTRIIDLLNLCYVQAMKEKVN